ncbi:hypothetical protein Mesil_3520 (plasmid) [Allomeiothermus silvanus DSM 9946]|uniref:Uncharacterized protein n=1 Tax=Allomeiothermus silvanus (strain ATCC 700542 / DSM 9946 / NBRC 106475 / NCIMB 13440 / VI-R2) TaxID=526227 RepID=D7BJG4_ALLS1|nr:DUF5615 family PIN-like protein [Allomeiothermus silvanus]ADH65320.1 hypothetical protein Mesil_3520 [Allomeiothermus silvanus DSM 9946]
MQKWRASPGTKGVTDPSALLQGITLEPEINHGQPTVRGLRYPVRVILELLAGGMTPGVVVTKDADCVQSLILQGKPYKLPLISTGNISNQALENLFLEQQKVLCELLNTYRYVELGREEMVAHL